MYLPHLKHEILLYIRHGIRFIFFFIAYKPTQFPVIIHLFTYSVLVFILSNLIFLNIHLDVTKWVLSSECLYFLIHCIAESSMGAVEYIACILELLSCFVVESLFLFNTIHSTYKKKSFTTCKQTVESSPCGANHEGEAVNLSQLVIIQHYLNYLFHIHVSVGIYSTSFSSTFYSKKWFFSVVLQM